MRAVPAVEARDDTGLDGNDFYFVDSSVTEISISGGFQIVSGQRVFNDGSTISVNGTEVATIEQNSVDNDGGDEGRLLLRLNANADSSDVDTLLRNLSFNSEDPSPGDGDNTTVDKVVRVTFDDGNTGGQGTGGALADTALIDLNLNDTNDAPSLTDGATVSVDEGSGNAGEVTLDSLLAANHSDPDGSSSFAGVALTGFSEQGLGTWQIDIGNGYVDISTFDTEAGGLAAGNALLLDGGAFPGTL